MAGQLSVASFQLSENHAWLILTTDN